MSAATASPALPLIPVARPVIGDREIDAVRRPLLSGWLTQGAEVAAFESEFAAFVGASHACAVSNCTTALHLALRALGVGPDHEVITVSHSFIATANAIRYCGALPVFVDIRPHTFNMAAERIESVITAGTKAILAVHQLGMPCDLRAIAEIANQRRIPLIEDAACAAGSEVFWRGHWERIGRPHGDIACFSFHPRKVMTTGEGGMLTTANADWDRQFRLWRQHSMSISDVARHQSRDITVEEYGQIGFNYRMTDLQAAIGREQLARLPAMVAERRDIARRYHQLLSGLPGVQVPQEPPWARSNWQSYCVRLPRKANQLRVMQSMLDAGVATRRGVMCAHREPAYKTEPWRCEGRGSPLMQSEAATDQCLILPLYIGMTTDDQARVVTALATALNEETRNS
jgi:perosamine synthetase